MKRPDLYLAINTIQSLHLTEAQFADLALALLDQAGLRKRDLARVTKIVTDALAKAGAS